MKKSDYCSLYLNCENGKSSDGMDQGKISINGKAEEWLVTNDAG